MDNAVRERSFPRATALGQYRGAEAAANFGSALAEYELLRTGAGIYIANWHSKIKIAGKDRVRWLNGMVSNNIRDLAPNRGVYCFVLNPKGQIQGDLYVYNRGEYLLVDTDQSQRERLLEIFKKFIVMDDVKLSSTDKEIVAIGLRGRRAKEILAASGLGGAEFEILEIRDSCSGPVKVSVAREAENNYELWVTPDKIDAVTDAMVGAGAQPVGYEALEMARIASGIPAYGQDIRERDLPQETGQQRALNFQKGCYIGQEIVERIRSRGSVHREFHGFVGDRPVAAGTKIEADGKEVGEITSSTSLPTTQGARHIALGYLRREAVQSEATLRAGDASVALAELPFENL